MKNEYSMGPIGETHTDSELIAELARTSAVTITITPSGGRDLAVQLNYSRDRFEDVVTEERIANLLRNMADALDDGTLDLGPIR